MNGWQYLFTFGYSLDIYARGNERIAVDKKTGKILLRYGVKNEKALETKNWQNAYELAEQEKIYADGRDMTYISKEVNFDLCEAGANGMLESLKVLVFFMD